MEAIFNDYRTCAKCFMQPTSHEADDMAWKMETLVVKGFGAWPLYWRLVPHILGLSLEHGVPRDLTWE